MPTEKDINNAQTQIKSCIKVINEFEESELNSVCISYLTPLTDFQKWILQVRKMSTLSLIDKCSETLNFLELYYKYTHMRLENLKFKRTNNLRGKDEVKII